MSTLTREQAFEGQKNGSQATLTSVALISKNLYDVSCLSEFRNLERLDLSFNSLTSLKALKSCVNLKWLSVSQNKLETLQGIQELCKLTVLNAGKNKLKSMEQVRSLGSLRALILNDNKIESICQLDTKELNTLVLSRNPISDIGNSLKKLKSLTKLSLSHCQLESVGSSLKSCSELREARFSHNEIKSLPSEMEHNKKLQNLDVGNNVLTTWADVKVLESLTSLKSLTIAGNPVAENAKFLRKIKNVLLKLRVFNSKPVENVRKSGNHEKISAVIEPVEDVKEKVKKRKKEPQSVNEKDGNIKMKSDMKDGELERVKKDKKKMSEIEVLDDCEASFVDIVAAKSAEISENFDEVEPVVIAPSKKRKIKKDKPIKEVHVEEIGLGGTSAWD